MAAITICSDFRDPQKWNLTLFPLFPHLFAMKWWDQMPWSWFSKCWALSQLFHSPLSLSSRGFLVHLQKRLAKHNSDHNIHYYPRHVIDYRVIPYQKECWYLVFHHFWVPVKSWNRNLFSSIVHGNLHIPLVFLSLSFASLWLI